MLQKKSLRAINLEQLWQTDESSFALMRKDQGEKITKLLLVIEIGNMCKLINADVQELQIKYLVDYILKTFYYFTISDITVMINKLVTMKPYGKPTVQNIIHELNQYDVERAMFAEDRRVEENDNHKKELVDASEYITKAYTNMKKKAKEPVKTQRQRDEENRIANEQRIEEMKREGLL